MRDTIELDSQDLDEARREGKASAIKDILEIIDKFMKDRTYLIKTYPEELKLIRFMPFELEDLEAQIKSPAETK